VIGFWGVPLTIFGSGRLAASSTVGATSMTWWNWERTSPFAVTRFGHDTMIPVRLPPKFDATCFVQVNGVSPATAQPADMWAYDIGPPRSSSCFRMSATDSCTPLVPGGPESRHDERRSEETEVRWKDEMTSAGRYVVLPSHLRGPRSKG
jgi:hypothetical protein